MPINILTWPICSQKLMQGTPKTKKEEPTETQVRCDFIEELVRIRADKQYSYQKKTVINQLKSIECCHSCEKWRDYFIQHQLPCIQKEESLGRQTLRFKSQLVIQQRSANRSCQFKRDKLDTVKKALTYQEKQEEAYRKRKEEQDRKEKEDKEERL